MKVTKIQQSREFEYFSMNGIDIFQDDLIQVVQYMLEVFDEVKIRVQESENDLYDLVASHGDDLAEELSKFSKSVFGVQTMIIGFEQDITVKITESGIETRSLYKDPFIAIHKKIKVYLSRLHRYDIALWKLFGPWALMLSIGLTAIAWYISIVKGIEQGWGFAFLAPMSVLFVITIFVVKASAAELTDGATKIRIDLIRENSFYQRHRVKILMLIIGSIITAVMTVLTKVLLAR